MPGAWVEKRRSGKRWYGDGGGLLSDCDVETLCSTQDFVGGDPVRCTCRRK